MSISVTEMIVKVLGGFPVAFGKATVEELAKRVQSATPVPKKGKRWNVGGLAYCVARNWAIDAQRRASAAARKQAAALLAKERARAERELFERCRKEFDEIYIRLLPKLHRSQPMQLHVVRLMCFEGYSFERCASALPGTSGEQRQKWKVRGMALVRARASDELRAYLKRFLKKTAFH